MADYSLSSVILITSADADHFDLALELIDSVRKHAALDSIRLGMLDVGLTESQRDVLIAKDVLIAPAQWGFDGEPPPGMPKSCLAMLSRPFLPTYFPAFDVFVSLDSDTWVQMASGVTDLAAGALRADIAVVPQMHPSYAHLYNPQHPIRIELRNSFAAVYGQEGVLPADNVVLNAGVFAARRDSRLWSLWAESLGEGLARVRHAVLPDGKPLFSVWHPIQHFIEQNALNHAIYRKGLSLYPMSALYNFICTLSQPLFDPEIRKLVEPSSPYAPIQIVHLTGAGKRVNQVMDRQGRTHARGLNWSAWRDIVMDE